MGLSDHVDISIARNSVGVQRATITIPLVLSANADAWPSGELTREYTDLASGAVDFPSTTGPEYLAMEALFSQNPAPKKVKVGKLANKPTQRYLLSVASAAAATTYKIQVDGDGVTSTETSFTSGPGEQVFTVNVDDTVTSATHGHANGAGPYRVSSGTTLPAGLAANTNYWISVLSANTWKFTTTYADAIAGTNFVNITDVGTGVHTLHTATNDVIAALTVDRLNAVTGKNYLASTTGSNGSLDVYVTGSAAGEWFALEVKNVALYDVKQDHADPGVATDLAAILLADPVWYYILSSYNSNAVVTAIAAWAEANKRDFVFDVGETEALNTAVGNSDTLDDIHASDYARSMGAYHPRPAEMLAAAWVGKTGSRGGGLTTIPSWKFQNLTGVSVTYITPTQRAKLIARNANLYETVAGQNWMSEGTTGSGEFLDTIVGLDWLEDDMGTGVVSAFAAAAANEGKIEYEDTGVATIEGKMKASLKRAVKKKILRANPRPETEVPLVADVDPDDRALRVLPDMKFSGELSGAIHKTIINGSVSA